MKQSLHVYICLAILILMVPAAPSGAEYVAGEILVKFRPKTSFQAVKVTHKAAGSRTMKEFSRIGLHQVQLPDNLTVEEAVRKYSLDPNVAYAEPNYIIHADSTFPNDPSFSQLWGLDNIGQSGGTADADIDAPEAWDITTGSGSTVLAVIDTGLAISHPDISANVWNNTGETSCSDGVDNDSNGYIDDCNGWDFLDNDNDPLDYHGHGTHIAGTIAAAGNNGTGVTGVMWQARIMPLRILGITGSGSTSNAISALLYAAAQGAQVINLSWGGSSYSQALKDAIEATQSLVVCAAGNGGRDAIGDDNDAAPHYPASFTSDNILAVAATDRNDALSSQSNFGSVSVDIAAPGVSVYSTMPQFSYAAPVTLYSSGFDSSQGPLPEQGWRQGGSNASWEVTGSTGVGGTNSLEDSPAANYLDGTVSWAGYGTPFVSVINNRYTLTFKWKGNLESDFDYLDINYSENGTSWKYLENITGSSGGIFLARAVDFTSVASSLSSFYIGFGLFSDASITRDGVFIDDVVFTREAISISGNTYASNNGTSMAAPHVSGVAGLILARNPSLTYAQVKALILNGADTVASVTQKVLTGGRLNAMNGVDRAGTPDMPTDLLAARVSSSQIDLAWTDNSSNEGGFRIERKPGQNEPYSEITSTSADVTSYADQNLSPSTRYYYRVRAFGASMGDFSYSNESSATTASAPSGGSGGSGSSSCFIATAAFGSPVHPYVRVLREFRDSHLIPTPHGRRIVQLYYRYSPPLAAFIEHHGILKVLVQAALIPMVLTVMFPIPVFFISTGMMAMVIVYFRHRRTQLN